jgi:hypothetical protein
MFLTETHRCSISGIPFYYYNKMTRHRERRTRPVRRSRNNVHDPYQIPRGPRLIGPEHVEVHDVPQDELNNYPGKIVSVLLDGVTHISLSNVTEPLAVVVIGRGYAVNGIGFSPESSATYVYDLQITSTMHASKAISCEPQAEHIPFNDPMPGDLEPGLTHFENCLFGGKEVLNYRVTYIPRIPGVYQDSDGGGRVACKWWVQPKSPRHWSFLNCTFEASQEHALYLHWAHSIRIVGCTFGADGGTAIQATQRYGKPSTLTYHGNPSMTPPAHGDFIVKDCIFNDAEIWSREGSTITVVGWVQGTIYIADTYIAGSRSAVAIWTDSFKGTYARKTNGDTYAIVTGEDEGDLIVQPGGSYEFMDELPDRLPGWPHPRVVIDGLHVGPGPHDREQIMVSGFAIGYFRNIEVDSYKQHLVLGARWGGIYGIGRVHLGEGAPTPLTWDGDRYVTLASVSVMVPRD